MRKTSEKNKMDNSQNGYSSVGNKRKKLRNGISFLFFPVTVAENSWKNQMSGNFVFSSWKMGVESRGTRRDPEGVEMGCTPA